MQRCAGASCIAGAVVVLGLVGDDRLLRLARHARLVGGGGDVAVGGAAPVAVQRRGRTSRPPASAGAGGASDQATGRPQTLGQRSTLTQPGASAASSRKRAIAASSDGGRGPLDGDVAVGVAREQQAAQRRVAAVPRAGPPHDRLVLGAGQRDVGEPQVLPALLVDVLAPCGVAGTRPGQADVDRALIARVRVVEDDRASASRRPRSAPTGTARRRPGTRAPCERWMVSTWTASASDSSRRERSSSPSLLGRVDRAGAATTASAAVPSRSAAAAPCSSWPTWRRSVSRRSPSVTAQHPPRQALDQRDRLGQRREPAPAQHAPPTRAAGGGRPPTPRRRPPRPAPPSSPGTTSSSPRARARVDAGRSSASSSRSHSRAAGVPNTLPAPLITDGHADARPARRGSARAWRL